MSETKEEIEKTLHYRNRRRAPAIKIGDIDDMLPANHSEIYDNYVRGVNMTDIKKIYGIDNIIFYKCIYHNKKNDAN